MDISSLKKFMQDRIKVTGGKATGLSDAITITRDKSKVTVISDDPFSKRTISASTQKNGAAASDNGMNWLMFELLWRDFFRFITKKYSSTKRKTEAVPATACTGALA